MATPHILVHDLHKDYVVPVREGGFAASLRSLVRRRYRVVHAVAGLSCQIQAGEVVGLLGPNGAGKTTALKVLSGLLHPTAGEVSVLGYRPWQRQQGFLRRITLVMGQKQQLVWDIPPMDTFLLNQAVYGIPAGEFRRMVDELVELLDLGAVIDKPVRNLSLGERMKCELAAALLHRPAVLFLDEPTIGLDVTMQSRIRQFVAEYNARHGATVILTSHYMADVAALCRRVIIVHQGRLLYDGALSELAARIAPFKTVKVAFSEPVAPLADGRFGEVVDQRDGQVVVRVAKHQVAQVTARMLAELPVADLNVEDPPIEAVIDQIFREGLSA